MPIFDATTSVKALIQMLFTITDLSIMTTDGETEFAEIKDFPTTIEFTKYFEVISNRNGNSVHVYFTISTSKFLRQVKDDADIYQYLQQNRIYMSHKGVARADQQAAIGFMLFRHPKITF